MASLSIPQPGKISDAQFIGDLMVLFERRKVKCGEPSSFADFASELGSNNKLRGDLFALCTAISHMAAEDLSGEELLVLVARALSGTGVAKGAAVPEIPESMRKAFLEGYEAWGNRAAVAMEEPAVWPPPRKTPMGDDVEPLSHADSEPAKPKDPAEGTRTIQEALDIARERSPNGTLGPRFNALPNNAPVPNIEHLTITELKKLLEDIEHRVKGIGPHLGQLGVAASNLAEVVRRDDPPVPRRAVLTFEPERAGPADGLTSAMPGGGASGEFDEEAYLARHVYLKPTARPARTEEKTAAPTLPDSAAAGAELAALSAAHAEAGAEAVADAPLVAANAVAPAASETGSPKAPMEFLAGYPQGVAQFSARARSGVLLAFAFFFLMAFTLGGIYVYHWLYPETIYDYSQFKPAPESASEGLDTQAAVPVPDLSHKNSNSHAAHAGAKATGRTNSPTVAPQGPAAAVWPPSNQRVRDAAPQDAASGAETATSRRTSPVHAEATANGSSTTIVGFATKPVHAEQANGISGTVMVEVSISRQGHVTNARVISGPQALRSAAIQTVQQWKFKPYLVDGVPAEVTTTLGVYVKGD